MALKVLQIIRGSGTFGGVASYLLTRYSFINHDRITFDFLFCQKNSFGVHNNDDVLRGSKITSLEALKKNNSFIDYWRLYFRLKKYLSDNKYDLVHINTGSLPITLICLLAAKKSGIDRRISHSHSSNYKNGRLNTSILLKPLRTLFQREICRLSTERLACSDMAANNMFGNASYTLMENSIQTLDFKFDVLVRNSVRSEMRQSDNIILGFVGRLDKSKNIDFLIDVFKDIVKKDKRYRLWIIGDGAEAQFIRERINDEQLKEYVKMLGVRTDVQRLMQAMDSLVFPSKYEGLSITVVEAQASGLPVYLSDTLSKEHRLTDIVHFLPLNNKEKWVSSIISQSNTKDLKRDQYNIEVRKAGYDIVDSVQKLMDIYEEK